MPLIIFLTSLSLLVGTSPSMSIEVPRLSHGIYLSVIRIDRIQSQSEVNVLIKVFADDLRSVLRAANQQEGEWINNNAVWEHDHPLIENYFQDNLKCLVNDLPTDLKFKTANLEGDIYWLQFVLTGPQEWKKLRLEAPFFTEIFSTQSNIVHLSHGDEKRFARLTKTNPEVVFYF